LNYPFSGHQTVAHSGDENMPDLTINPEVAFSTVLKAHEYHGKVDQTDPDSASNRTDDGSVDTLELGPQDQTSRELVSVVRHLNDTPSAASRIHYSASKTNLAPDETIGSTSWLHLQRKIRLTFFGHCTQGKRQLAQRGAR
jgi:hypothetical protein